MVHQSISGIEKVGFFRGVRSSLAPSMIDTDVVFTEVFLFLIGGSTQWAVWFCS